MRGKRIPGLKKYQGRNPNGYFHKLDWHQRRRAYYWLGVFCKRWDRNLPPWRFAILVGRAKWLALYPPTSAWGRSMLAERGGKAVQRIYRHEGRHPTEIATQVHRANARMRKDSEERKRHGLPVRLVEAEGDFRRPPLRCRARRIPDSEGVRWSTQSGTTSRHLH